MRKKSRVKSANNHVNEIRNVGGKDLVLNKMVNHYIALANVKSVLDMKTPHPHVGKHEALSVQASSYTFLKLRSLSAG